MANSSFDASFLLQRRFPLTSLLCISTTSAFLLLPLDVFFRLPLLLPLRPFIELPTNNAVKTPLKRRSNAVKCVVESISFCGDHPDFASVSRPLAVAPGASFPPPPYSRGEPHPLLYEDARLLVGPRRYPLWNYRGALSNSRPIPSEWRTCGPFGAW